MRGLVIKTLIVCLYCFPFVYISIYKDFSNGSMIGYLIMVIATSILAFCSKLFSNIIPLIIGNILSAIISFYSLYRMDIMLGDGWDGGYFKPFSPYQLLLLVSLLNLIPQFISMKLASGIKKRKVDSVKNI